MRGRPGPVSAYGHHLEGRLHERRQLSGGPLGHLRRDDPAHQQRLVGDAQPELPARAVDVPGLLDRRPRRRVAGRREPDRHQQSLVERGRPLGLGHVLPHLQHRGHVQRADPQRLGRPDRRLLRSRPHPDRHLPQRGAVPAGLGLLPRAGLLREDVVHHGEGPRGLLHPDDLQPTADVRLSDRRAAVVRRRASRDQLWTRQPRCRLGAAGTPLPQRRGLHRPVLLDGVHRRLPRGDEGRLHARKRLRKTLQCRQPPAHQRDHLRAGLRRNPHDDVGCHDVHHLRFGASKFRRLREGLRHEGFRSLGLPAGPSRSDRPFRDG